MLPMTVVANRGQEVDMGMSNVKCQMSNDISFYYQVRNGAAVDLPAPA